MRVLFATMQFGRGYAQGTERYLDVLAAGLQARGHEVAILAGDPERRGPRRRLGDPIQSQPPVLHYPTRDWTAVRGLAAEALLPLLRQKRPDIVHLANPAHVGVGLVQAAKLARVPLVITVVDFWWLCPKHTLWHYQQRICTGQVPWTTCLRCLDATDPRPFIRRPARIPLARHILPAALYFARAWRRQAAFDDVLRWTHRRGVLAAALRAADAVIFLSNTARHRLANRLEPARVHTITVGMEDRWFDVRHTRAARSAPRTPANLVLGFAGALAEHKGPHLLLEALHQLHWHTTRVRMAGSALDSRYEQRLRQLAQGLNVEFAGRVPTEDMPAFLSGLDLLVVPSLCLENLPQTVLEAQAAGVPVLASRVDGIREVLDDPRTLFQPGSSTDLARALAAWMDDRVPVGGQRPTTADEMVARTIAVYESVLQRFTGTQRPADDQA